MIETDTFQLNVPDTWKVEALGNRLQILTLQNGFIILSSTSISGDGSKEILKQTLEKIEQNVVNSMLEAAKNPELEKPMGPVKEVLKNGSVYQMMASFTHDKTYFFTQFSIKGPRTVVLVTFEGPAVAGQEIDAVSQLLK